MDHGEKKEQVALSSVVASLLLTALKFVVGLMTGSIGIMSEAAHSLLDFGAAALTFYAVRMSDKPADEKHHYGHAKVESVSALIETALLIVTSVWIIYSAVERLVSGGTEIDVTWYAVAVMVTSIVVDVSRARALKKVARETNSQALEADALHFSSDILSSAVVLVGLGFVSLGIEWADAVAGIAVAVLVGKAAFELGRKTIDVLIDAAPEGIADRITEIAGTVPGVISIEKLRVKPTGPQIFVEMAVCVNRTLSVSRVQDIAAQIESLVRDEFPVGDMTINSRPIALNSESLAERVQVIGLNHNLHAHNISASLSENRKQLTFDVEIDQWLTIREAHARVTALEEELHREFDESLDICIHLDPLRFDSQPTLPLPQGEEDEVRSVIVDASKSIERIHDVHDIRVLRTEQQKLFITLHCSFNDDALLEEVHSLTSQLEGLIYRSLRHAARVIIHAEPLAA